MVKFSLPVAILIFIYLSFSLAKSTYAVVENEESAGGAGAVPAGGGDTGGAGGVQAGGGDTGGAGAVPADPPSCGADCAGDYPGNGITTPDYLTTYTLSITTLAGMSTVLTVGPGYSSQTTYCGGPCSGSYPLGTFTTQGGLTVTNTGDSFTITEGGSTSGGGFGGNGFEFETFLACGFSCGISVYAASVSPTYCPTGLTCSTNNTCLPSSCAANPASCSCTALFNPPPPAPPSCSGITVSPTTGGSLNAGWNYQLTAQASGGQGPFTMRFTDSCQYIPTSGGGYVTNHGTFVPSSGQLTSLYTVPVPAPLPGSYRTGAGNPVCTVSFTVTDSLGQNTSCTTNGSWVNSGIQPTLPPPPTLKQITGVLYFDLNNDGIRERGENCFSKNNVLVKATTNDGLSPQLTYQATFSCPSYTLNVADKRNYDVTILNLPPENFSTGWDNGCNPATPDCKGTTLPPIVKLSFITPAILPPTLTPTLPFAPKYPTATPVGYREPDPYAYLYPTSTPPPPTPTPQPSLLDNLWDASLGRFFPSATPLLQPTSTPPPVPTATPTITGGRIF